MNKGKMFYFNSDVLIHYSHKIWLASNPRIRKHVQLDVNAIDLIIKFTEGKKKNTWIKCLNNCNGNDRTKRHLGISLHSDHSGISNTPGNNLKGIDLFNLLCKNRILISNYNDSNNLVQPLSNPLDFENLGTFHQRIGQSLLVRRETKTWKSWQDQKFTKDGLNLKEGVYKLLQENFFNYYFSKERVTGKKILDFGCGNAYFSSRLVKAGADVLAIDNSTELISIAKKNYGDLDGLKIVETSDFNSVIKLLSNKISNSYDYITFQDTLLLLLEPDNGKVSHLLEDLFIQFHRILKPDGRLCAMEPNSLFWLSNRFGDQNQPYAVITEYYNSIFNVVPNLEKLMRFMKIVGFVLRDFKHPRVKKNLITDLNITWQNEFPTWDFFEFTPKKNI